MGWRDDARGQTLDPKSLAAALAAKPAGADAEQLAARIRTWFGGTENLRERAGAENRRPDRRVGDRGAGARGQRRRPRVVSDVVAFTMPLVKVGDSGLYAGVATLSHGYAHDVALRGAATGGSAAGSSRSTRRTPTAASSRAFRRHAEADADVGEQDLRRHDARLVGLRAGAVQRRVTRRGDGLPGRRRREGLRADRVRQPDREGRHARHGRHLHPAGRVQGGRPLQPELRVRHAVRSVRALPAGRDPARGREDGEAAARRGEPRHRRAPAAAASAPSRSRGSGRTSSARSLSWIGSFTNIASGPTVRAGGHNYEALVRKTPKKPIRVFLQDGANDLDNANGNWPLANQTLAKSLAFAGYDYRFEFGQRLPQQPARPGDPARFAALAVARLPALSYRR